MDLAKVTSKGQITIPISIRKKLGVKTGDRVFFVEENGRIYLANSSIETLWQMRQAYLGTEDLRIAEAPILYGQDYDNAPHIFSQPKPPAVEDMDEAKFDSILMQGLKEAECGEYEDLDVVFNRLKQRLRQ